MRHGSNGTRWARWRCPSRPITGRRLSGPAGIPDQPAPVPSALPPRDRADQEGGGAGQHGPGTARSEARRADPGAAQAVADGQHDDQFVVDIFQTGSGTSTNMNTNEVIAGHRQRAVQPAIRGGKRPSTPTTP